MSHTFWTGYEITMLAAVIALLRFGLHLPPSLGRSLIRAGAVIALVEAVLWLLGVFG
jgi:hypothetical protein